MAGGRVLGNCPACGEVVLEYESRTNEGAPGEIVAYWHLECWLAARDDKTLAA